MMGGPAADLMAWFAEDTPTPVAGRCGGRKVLPAWLQAFRPNLKPGQLTWELPAALNNHDFWQPSPYSGEGTGLGRGFPHRLTKDASPRTQMVACNCTPHSDRAVVDLALLTAQKMQLGGTDVCDLLFLSLAATDVVGHIYGPFTQERAAVHDGVDESLGILIGEFIQRVPKHELFIALTADHGVMPVVAQATASGEKVGTLAMADVARLAEEAVQGLTTAADAVTVKHPFVYLRHPEPHKRQLMAQLVKGALAQHPSIWAAWTATELNEDPRTEAKHMRNSWTPERGGDVIFVPNPYHKPVLLGEEEAAEHATPWHYDAHVPAILWGNNVAPAATETPVSVVDFIEQVVRRLPLDRRRLEKANP